MFAYDQKLSAQQAAVRSYLLTPARKGYVLRSAEAYPCGKSVQVILTYRAAGWKSDMFYSEWMIIGPRGGTLSKGKPNLLY